MQIFTISNANTKPVIKVMPKKKAKKAEVNDEVQKPKAKKDTMKKQADEPGRE